MKLKYTIKRMDDEIFLYCIKKELTYKIDEYMLDILKKIKDELDKKVTINDLFNIVKPDDKQRFINDIAVLIKLGVI